MPPDQLVQRVLQVMLVLQDQQGRQDRRVPRDQPVQIPLCLVRLAPPAQLAQPVLPGQIPRLQGLQELPDQRVLRDRQVQLGPAVQMVLMGPLVQQDPLDLQALLDQLVLPELTQPSPVQQDQLGLLAPLVPLDLLDLLEQLAQLAHHLL